MRGFGLKRSKGLAKENQSEYFYKDLIVEPRKNPVFKQWSEPFSLETMRKCDYNELPLTLDDTQPNSSVSERQIVPTIP